MAVETAAPRDLREEVEAYYRVVAPLLPYELAQRGDERYWSGLGRLYRGGRILEIGAGTGRVTALLAAHAATVVALDLADCMIQTASLSLTRLARVSWVQADMRHLPFEAAFDLVVCANDPFSHLMEDADRLSAMGEAARSLCPDGRLVLDALWFPPEERRQATHQGRRLEHAQLMNGRTLQVVERWQCDAETRRCTGAYEYHLDGRLEARAAFRARYWTMGEIQRACARAGLRMDARWGSYDRAVWDHRTSRHLIVEARRR
jgi:SAM-dependent methyltransferase